MFERGGFWCGKVTIVSCSVWNIPLSPYIGMIPIFNMASDLLISWFFGCENYNSFENDKRLTCALYKKYHDIHYFA